MTSLVEAGSRVGRYLLTRRLGIGGSAEVWEAEDQELRRRVAIELALPALCEEPAFVERFLREARRAANLDHPHILAVYGFGMHEGRPFLVMPVVPGGSLASRMSPPPPVKDAVRWLGELAAALDHAHEEGVIHRDVEPPNALFDRKGRLLLSDFGIARSLEESTVLTQTGAAIGTPAFMAPEQALARPDKVPIGPAADQYALGILACKTLAGRFPFEGPTFALLRKTIEEPPPPPSTCRQELSPEVDAAFARVLAKVAGDRYGSREAFVTSLANVEAADAAAARARPWDGPRLAAAGGGWAGADGAGHGGGDLDGGCGRGDTPADGPDDGDGAGRPRLPGADRADAARDAGPDDASTRAGAGGHAQARGAGDRAVDRPRHSDADAEARGHHAVPCGSGAATPGAVRSACERAAAGSPGGLAVRRYSFRGPQEVPGGHAQCRPRRRRGAGDRRRPDRLRGLPVSRIGSRGGG